MERSDWPETGVWRAAYMIAFITPEIVSQGNLGAFIFQ
jgi:hypothetical protein